MFKILLNACITFLFQNKGISCVYVSVIQTPIFLFMELIICLKLLLIRSTFLFGFSFWPVSVLLSFTDRNYSFNLSHFKNKCSASPKRLYQIYKMLKIVLAQFSVEQETLAKMVQRNTISYYTYQPGSFFRIANHWFILSLRL